MAIIDVLSPVPAEAPLPQGLQPARRPGLSGATRLALVDNGKPRGRELLLMIADLLRERGAAGEVSLITKGSASSVLDDAKVSELATGADAVIAGLGDCGACSACSLADAIRMEAAGVPATVVISDVFVGHVASFAASLGLPGYHATVVPHPVSSKNDEQLSAYAAAAADQVLAQLGHAQLRAGAA